MVDQLREVPELGICGKKTPQADYALGDSRYLSIGVWPSSPGWGAGEAARSSLDIFNVVSPQVDGAITYKHLERLTGASAAYIQPAPAPFRRQVGDDTPPTETQYFSTGYL